MANEMFSTGVKAASAVVRANECYLEGVVVFGNGNTSSNPIALSVYDNATTSTGTVLAQAVIKASDKMGGFFLPLHIKASYGIVGKVSGTSASYMTFWSNI